MPTPKGGRPVYNPSSAIQTSINMGTGLKPVADPSALTDWQDVVNKDENLRGLTPEAATNYLHAAWGLPNTYKLDRAGNIVDARGFVMRNLWWIGPAALVGGSAIGSVATGAATGAGVTGAAPTAINGFGGSITAAAKGIPWGTIAKYGIQYGLPAAVGAWGTKSQLDAQRDSDRLMADYYNRALEEEIKERDYRRGFDEEGRRYDRAWNEEGRGYTRAFNEEGRNYGRAKDTYGRLSDEDILNYGRAKDTYGRLSDEDILNYGRAKDTYGRASDEERLWYDRSQTIRDKNYGYQQYGNFVETLEPFRAGGTAAMSRMSGLMGGPEAPSTGSYLNLAQTARDSVQAVPNVPDRPTWTFEPNRPSWTFEPNRPTWTYDDKTAPSRQQSAPKLAPGGSGRDTISNIEPTFNYTDPGRNPAAVITMRTPAGQTFTVTPNEVAQYEARGAQRV